jgi:hypothetical protein
LITTPNNSIWPPGAVWETDLPPVHFWWFSQESVRVLAQKHQCSVRFFDFSHFYAQHYVLPASSGRTALMAKQAVFSSDGKLLIIDGPAIVRAGTIRKILSTTGLLQAARLVRDRVMGFKPYRGATGPILCAILEKMC